MTRLPDETASARGAPAVPPESASWLLESAPVPMRCSEGRGFAGHEAWSRAHRDDRLPRPGGSSPPHALCSPPCTPQTHGGPLQHPHEVDRVLAVLDTQEMMVDGRDLRRPLVAEGEDVQTSVASIPLGRPASADVLQASCAACGSVTWAKVLEAGGQIPRLERVRAADPRRHQA